MRTSQLDMNGIIHNCTHKDSDSPSFRMTEDEMYLAIFNYIEHLFGKIKPKSLFFMAVDGVAPRAKMNQQRARRFRTALDNEKAREKALREGHEMPKEPPFDSNCITPGTEFMAKLTRQIKYFVSKKVSEDADWRGVEIVLSGHEVPGEGEHKIMEYIRQAKSQPNYDPNVRHCLYGLDADLIMLGLLSHDPHFCLLREEVTFGRQSKSKSKELAHQNFYLMHLCMVREYLELEFQGLANSGVLPFEFDMERVIDDFILMAFFVGNDFLPNLPHLHINEGALALMFETYKKVLPAAGGYINQGGQINLQRLGILLDELSKVEYRFFESENSDASWLKSKQKSNTEESRKAPRKGAALVVTTSQKAVFKEVKKWANTQGGSMTRTPLNLPEALPASDREFVKTLADSLHVQWETVETETGGRRMQLTFPPPLGDGDDDEEDEEAQMALFRVLKRYDNAKVVDVSPEDESAEMQKKYDQKFVEWKDQYYKSKFEWGIADTAPLTELAQNYVQGLQWVLYYYYRGIASWPWFFRYHYSPMISDVKLGLQASMQFELGQPFRPYQQLMGVLPDRSKSIVPPIYHELMTDPNSPIIDFYPRDFDLDMNGKKMEWEAVVKIPFIDEKRLLEAMATKDAQLSPDEKRRNEFGATLKFTYEPGVDYHYASSLPGVFQDIPHCKCVENIYELPTMDGLEVHVGLVEGVKLGVDSLAGFPSMKVLPSGGALGFHQVNVFQQESRNQSMIITLLESENSTKASNAVAKLGQTVHVGYPYLQEGKVVRITDELFEYTLVNGQIAQKNNDDMSAFEKTSRRIEEFYSKRLGVVIGGVESLVHVEMLKGLIKTQDGAYIKEYGAISGLETAYASQTVVDNVVSEDTRFIERAAVPIDEEFPVGSNGFFLTPRDGCYGRPLQVARHCGGDKVDCWVSMDVNKIGNAWGRQVVQQAEQSVRYTPSYRVAQDLKLNSLALSKITASFTVLSSSLRLNLGLNLKFEAKKLKVLGYSRKGRSGWEFSDKAIQLIMEYMIKFPEFIAGLQANAQGDGFNDTDFYPKEVAASKMKEIGQWLKAVEARSMERVPLDAEQLDSDAVAQVEKAADSVLANVTAPVNKKWSNLPRHSILKPSDAEQRLGNQRFTLGDRLVYAQDSGKVPVGLTGTVVGIDTTQRVPLLDVVFDQPFMSGSTIGERCSPFRGASVPTSSVLNLTDQQVVVHNEATAARHRQQGSTQYLATNGYASAGGFAGRYVDAAAPAPLNGSYTGAARGRGRGAVSQQTLPIHNGPPANGFTRGRGRGGANRGGYTIVDNSDPKEGVIKNNPNFRPRSYANVPPPATIPTNARGQRGGRGGPRGQGGRGGHQRGGSNGRGGGRGGNATVTGAAS